MISDDNAYFISAMNAAKEIQPEVVVIASDMVHAEQQIQEQKLEVVRIKKMPWRIVVSEGREPERKWLLVDTKNREQTSRVYLIHVLNMGQAEGTVKLQLIGTDREVREIEPLDFKVL